MPDSVRIALMDLRRVELELGLVLARAMRSGKPRHYHSVARHIARAEHQMSRLERELTIS